ncbi:MAG: sce7726 family protein [Holophagaceae bacterium]|nr:sce7726 family protein [Holophagaceae bacterium]
MAQSPSLLSERSIRDALVSWLSKGLGGDDVLIEELGVEHGAARVDIALASDRLLGFEIKSDFDTLDRLARQMHTYHRVFDALTIVTTITFVNHVEALLPRWWGILIAAADDDGVVVLHQYRAAVSHDRQDPESLAALLWRDEAYGFLMSQSGPVVKAKAARSAIYQAIAMAVPFDRIREEVISALQSRQSLRPRSHLAS